MSKTYRVPVVAMAQKIAGKWNSTQLRYQITKTDGVWVQFDKIPTALVGVLPKSAKFMFYLGRENGTLYNVYLSGYESEYQELVAKNTCSIQIKSSTTEINIINGVFGTSSETSNVSVILPPIKATYKTRATGFETSGYDLLSTGYGYSETRYISSASEIAKLVQQGGKLVPAEVIYEYPYIYTALSEHESYVELEYDEGDPIVSLDTPTGYRDYRSSIHFSWHTTYEGFQLENLTQTAATLQWRNGTSGAIHSIAISGDRTEYTMPANTLPQSQEIQWRVLAETVEGSAESSWRSLQTEDSYPTVKGISPAGIYVDGTDVVRFVWGYASDTGAPQKRYDLQYKTNTSDWIDLRSETSADAFSDVPAGVLPAGAIQWRVRGYNQDDIASAWSDPLSAIVISAPATPTVTVTGVSPRPTVSWTAIDQQAYQVRFGTYDTGTLFGTTKTMKSPVFLPDGRTSVYVRVMNLYGFWSPWGTASLTVANIPSETALNLNVSGTQDAVLSWTEDTNAAGYHIYRNGEKIAETNQTTYTDRYSIGQTSYFVRAIYSGNDYYTDSKTVAVTLSTDCPIITATDGDWVRLEHTTTALPTVQISSTQAVGMMTYNGTDYPVPELSPHRTRTYILNAAFKDVSEALRFEALIGRVCCLKDQYGNRIVGMISNVTRAHSRFYTVCTATLNEIGGEVL